MGGLSEGRPLSEKPFSVLSAYITSWASVEIGMEERIGEGSCSPGLGPGSDHLDFVDLQASKSRVLYDRAIRCGPVGVGRWPERFAAVRRQGRARISDVVQLILGAER